MISVKGLESLIDSIWRIRADVRRRRQTGQLNGNLHIDFTLHLLHQRWTVVAFNRVTTADKQNKRYANSKHSIEYMYKKTLHGPPSRKIAPKSSLFVSFDPRSLDYAAVEICN